MARPAAALALLAALLLLSGCMGGGGGSTTTTTRPTTTTPPTSTTPAPPALVTVQIQNSQYKAPGGSSSVTVHPGDSVQWRNEDSFAHTVTSDPGTTPPFDTGDIPGGTTSAPVVFAAVGTYSYHCSIHSTMHGSVVVQS
jgi:plastocyanin